MKAMVTGGAGFIGSHLVERLLRDGHRVTIVDDLSTGSLNNLQSVRDNKSFSFVQDSVRNAQKMEYLIKNCDVVYHLAAAVGVQLIVDEPVRTIETNIHGCEVVLEAANKYGRRVLIASSSEVYGKSDAVPFSEDDDAVLGSTRFARWSYACSKAIDEFLAFAYRDQFNLPVIVARIFNTIGPRQTGEYGMVVPRFVRSAVKNEPVVIYGTGKQTRCFAHVGDIVDGLVAMMESDKTAGGVYNIGSDEEVTIEALADKIIELAGSQSKKQYLSYEQAYGRPFDDMMRRVPCLEKIKAVTGYEPKMSLEQALQSVIEDVKSRL